MESQKYAWDGDDEEETYSSTLKNTKQWNERRAQSNNKSSHTLLLLLLFLFNSFVVRIDPRRQRQRRRRTKLEAQQWRVKKREWNPSQCCLLPTFNPAATFRALHKMQQDAPVLYDSSGASTSSGTTQTSAPTTHNDNELQQSLSTVRQQLVAPSFCDNYNYLCCGGGAGETCLQLWLFVFYFSFTGSFISFETRSDFTPGSEWGNHVAICLGSEE